MKKMLLVLLVLVALGAGTALLLSFAPSSPPRRGVETTFLEFTNTPSGPSARFGVSYRPRFRGWGVRGFETSLRRADGTWEEWSAADDKRTVRFLDNNPNLPRTRDGRKISTVIELPVPHTNAVWRIVLNVDESPPLPPWPILMAHRLKTLVRNRPPPQMFGPDQSYLLTNETRAIKMN